ncbi:MAG: HEAT repeat domain-containing protein [Planctomycetes bacterium]|nr:HEAT repeat domain-containing protein [Planctomycetota bacterium]
MDNSTAIRNYIDQFREGNRNEAFHGLLELSHDVLPELIAIFRNEQDVQFRAFLAEVTWQHREPSVIPFLGEILNDPEPLIWKEALDGLVALASVPALDALRAARSRQFARKRDAEYFLGYLEEAIGQAEAEILKKDS